MSENEVFATILIPTCDRVDLLSRCLLALEAQVKSVHDVEVLVCDDGKTTESKDLLERQFPWCRWISGPKKGAGINRNNGARHALGEWLLFLDDDCVPDNEWLGAYLSAIRKDPNRDVTFEGRTYSEKNLLERGLEAPVNETGGALPSCNFAISKSLFARYQFRECFRHWMEDVDLHSRLREGGYAPEFVHQASAFHPPRPLPGAWLLSSRWRARLLFERLKGKSMSSLFVWLPWHVFRLRSNTLGIVKAATEAVLVGLKLPLWAFADQAVVSRERQSSAKLKNE